MNSRPLLNYCSKLLYGFKKIQFEKKRLPVYANDHCVFIRVAVSLICILFSSFLNQLFKKTLWGKTLRSLNIPEKSARKEFGKLAQPSNNEFYIIFCCSASC